MGVPGFFAWLMKKYPGDLLAETPSEPIEALYLDWNGGIHPACRHVLQRYVGRSASRQEIEAECLDAIMAYLLRVVEAAAPTRMLYIAIDGVAPRAKMNQQRSRRYKSARDKVVVDEIKRRHQQPLDHPWDTNAITPGTAFMRSLCARLQAEASSLFPSLEVVVNDANTAMEGEHKIIRHIRASPAGVNAIYGLDADLIFLSLLAEPRVFLMRERDQFDGPRAIPGFRFVNVQALAERIGDLMSSSRGNPVHDFVVLCFFLGNDFLPKLPCLFIHDGGIDALIAAYTETASVRPDSAVVNGSLNMEFLADLLQRLAPTEGQRLREYFRRNLPRFSPRPGATAFEIELAQYDCVWPPPEDPVMQGKQGWKDRYYQHYFHLDRRVERHCQNSILSAYTKTLIWTWRYYTEERVPSWSWYYPYHHAPCLSDLASFFARHPRFEARLHRGKPVTPDVQLLCVLPPQSFGILETRQKRAISLLPKSNYPDHFEEDCLHKRKRWQTVALLPFVDADQVAQALSLQRAHDDAAAAGEMVPPGSSPPG